MAASTAPRKNFITRDHRYVYLGGSLIALLGLSMFYSAPSTYSFIPAQSVFGTALDVTLSELTLETFFPADAETAQALRALADSLPS